MDTPWEAGRLDTPKGRQRLLFGQMHEDAEIERAAFEGKGRLFCIASAGATALELAAQHEVVACDINPVQLAYAQRRATGAPAMIGDAERAMNLARRFMPLIGWRQETVQTFLTFSDISEQMIFWREHLDTLRLRAGLDVLLSRTLLRTLYASQFLSFLPPQFDTIIRKRLETGFSPMPTPRIHMRGHSCSENPAKTLRRLRESLSLYWEMRPPFWSPALPVRLTASHFQTSWMEQNCRTGPGLRGRCDEPPQTMLSLYCEALRSLLQSFAAITPNAIAPCCGVLSTSAQPVAFDYHDRPLLRADR